MPGHGPGELRQVVHHTHSVEYRDLIGASRSLFARKFDPLNADSLALVDHTWVLQDVFLDKFVRWSI